MTKERRRPRLAVVAREAVAEYREAYLRVHLKAAVLAFASLWDHLRRCGIDSKDKAASDAVVAHFCGREGRDYDVEQNSDGGVREVLECAGITKPNAEDEVRALASQPWRSVMSPLAVAVDKLARTAASVGLDETTISPVFSLRTYLRGGGIRGMSGALSSMPKAAARDLMGEALTVCLRVEDRLSADSGVTKGKPLVRIDAVDKATIRELAKHSEPMRFRDLHRAVQRSCDECTSDESAYRKRLAKLAKMKPPMIARPGHALYATAQ